MGRVGATHSTLPETVARWFQKYIRISSRSKPQRQLVTPINNGILSINKRVYHRTILVQLLPSLFHFSLVKGKTKLLSKVIFSTQKDAKLLENHTKLGELLGKIEKTNKLKLLWIHKKINSYDSGTKNPSTIDSLIVWCLCVLTFKTLYLFWTNFWILVSIHNKILIHKNTSKLVFFLYLIFKNTSYLWGKCPSIKIIFWKGKI